MIRRHIIRANPASVFVRCEPHQPEELGWGAGEQHGWRDTYRQVDYIRICRPFALLSGSFTEILNTERTFLRLMTGKTRKVSMIICWLPLRRQNIVVRGKLPARDGASTARDITTRSVSEIRPVYVSLFRLCCQSSLSVYKIYTFKNRKDKAKRLKRRFWYVSNFSRFSLRLTLFKLYETVKNKEKI